MFVDVRTRIQPEIFDYQILIDALNDLSAPRDKITELLRQGVIVRVKKGLYVYGDRYRRRPYSMELLANLVYGPSYVSLDYALAYHGLIPERVEALTSVTPSRSRRFVPSIGLFVYRQIPARAYEFGMIRVEADHEQAFLIASPSSAFGVESSRSSGCSTASTVSRRAWISRSSRRVTASISPTTAIP